jgi:hypothetical protein
MSSRKTDLVFIGYNKIVPKVIYARNTAIGPEILKKVFFNKLTTTISYITDVFVKGQDLSYLFLNGDSAAIYASTFTGQFFLICLIFYYLGFIFLGKEFNKEYFYVLGFIPISLISSMVNIDYVSVAIRSILASVSFAFIIACGIIFFLDLIKKIKKSFRRVIYIFLAAFIFIELSYFVYNYFFRREITMFEMFFEHEKQISLFLNSNKKPYIIYDDSPRNILASYLFLNKDINITKAQKIFKQGIPYMYDGFIFKICPSSPKEIVLKNKMIIADSCTDEKLYQKLNGDSRVKKIPFQDFSSRTAFFIID